LPVSRQPQAQRIPLDDDDAGYIPPDDELLAIDEALTRLAAEDAQAARLIQLRYFGGLSVEEAAGVVGLARSTAYEHWASARVRLRCLLQGE
jgi:DNA-directed RNA polymerase specialized sigma24 family protein